MSTSSYQTPGAVRIGDRERDQATDCLREHMAAGRLDPVEFDQRIETALTARYAEDLQPLFVDLPEPRPDLPTGRPEPSSEAVQFPSPESKPYPQPAGSRPAPVVAWRTLTLLAWVAAIAVNAATGWQLWWLMFAPLLMGGGWGRRGFERREHRLAMGQAHWTAHQRHLEMRMQRLDRRRW